MYTAQTYNDVNQTWLFINGAEFLSIPVKDLKGDALLEGRDYNLSKRGRLWTVTLANTPENREFITHIPA